MEQIAVQLPRPTRAAPVVHRAPRESDFQFRVSVRASGADQRIVILEGDRQPSAPGARLILQVGASPRLASDWVEAFAQR
jgi:hypothetical protein